ncbi:MAG TPA: cyanophycinase [Candidatus Eremiobacteraceae bacterium]|nr:cyanophycinase [Candidatus Eremiobacteraceae bacterium]
MRLIWLSAVIAIAASLAPAAAATTACHAIFYNPVGTPETAAIRSRGPGLVLMGGGTDVDSAFRWIATTIAGSPSRDAGDLVVLRASGDNDYDAYIHGLGRYHSVRTILLPPCASASDISRAAAIVSRAQAVFFAGGDQADYVIWKGTSLAGAVQQLYDRGGVVGGTSAGLAILGSYVFDAVAGDRTHDVHTPDAVADPYEPAISFTEKFFDFPPLRGVITDTHFRVRDRFGRLAAFMALLDAEHGAGTVRAIAMDARSALVVDRDGVGTLLLQGSGGRALFVRGGEAVRLQRGRPLIVRGLDVVVLDRAGQRFDVRRWCGDGLEYSVDVDGDRKAMYSPTDPYIAPPGAHPAASCRL